MKHETAWAAGLFDGEGCTTLRSYTNKSGRDYCYLTIVINQSGSPEVLERFRNAVGSGRICGPYDKQREGRLLTRPFWQFNQSGLDAWDILRKLAPFLSSAKREQALRCMERARPFALRPKLTTRGRRFSRKTHCVAGHKLESGAPCRQCANRRNREYKARKRAA